MEPYQIMIVEDERIVAADLEETLREFGYSVVGVVNSGEKAVQQAALLKPDLILMDVMLKGKANGIETAGMINEESSIPVIYITANGDNSTFRTALDTNPFGYLLKPFKKNELRSSLEFAFSVSEEKPEEAASFNFRINGSSAVLAEKENSPFENILGRYDTDLHKLVTEMKHNMLTQTGMNLLIKVSYKLALFKVKKNISRLLNVNKRWDLSTEDIAIEGISNLFIMNAKRNMLNLKSSLLDWEDEITDSTDALFFLNKAVGISIEQYINKLFRDSDPVFAKVLDTINFAVRKYNYSKQDYFGVQYVTQGDSGRIMGSVISYDDFMNIPFDMQKSKNEMLSALLAYFAEETDYFPAVPLNAFVERLLGCRQTLNELPSAGSPSHFARISTDDIIACSLDAVLAKLKESYLDTGKLLQEEASDISSALSDIAFDLREGNTIWQISEYLKIYRPEMTKMEYARNYQNIFEYLVKRFKSLIAAKLRS
ncbi:MAG: response regulator [Syntrophothermus sp.]